MFSWSPAFTSAMALLICMKDDHANRCQRIMAAKRMGITARVMSASSQFIRSMAMMMPPSTRMSPSTNTKMDRNSWSCWTSFCTLDIMFPSPVRAK